MIRFLHDMYVLMRVASQENRRLRSWRIVIVHAEALSYAAPHTLPCRATAGYLNKDDIKVAVTALLGVRPSKVHM